MYLAALTTAINKLKHAKSDEEFQLATKTLGDLCMLEGVEEADQEKCLELMELIHEKLLKRPQTDHRTPEPSADTLNTIVNVLWLFSKNAALVSHPRLLMFLPKIGNIIRSLTGKSGEAELMSQCVEIISRVAQHTEGRTEILKPTILHDVCLASESPNAESVVNILQNLLLDLGSESGDFWTDGTVPGLRCIFLLFAQRFEADKEKWSLLESLASACSLASVLREYNPHTDPQQDSQKHSQKHSQKYSQKGAQKDSQCEAHSNLHKDSRTNNRHDLQSACQNGEEWCEPLVRVIVKLFSSKLTPSQRAILLDLCYTVTLACRIDWAVNAGEKFLWTFTQVFSLEIRRIIQTMQNTDVTSDYMLLMRYYYVLRQVLNRVKTLDKQLKERLLTTAAIAMTRTCLFITEVWNCEVTSEDDNSLENDKRNNDVRDNIKGSEKEGCGNIVKDSEDDDKKDSEDNDQKDSEDSDKKESEHNDKKSSEDSDKKDSEDKMEISKTGPEDNNEGDKFNKSSEDVLKGVHEVQSKPNRNCKSLLRTQNFSRAVVGILCTWFYEVSQAEENVKLMLGVLPYLFQMAANTLVDIEENKTPDEPSSDLIDIHERMIAYLIIFRKLLPHREILNILLQHQLPEILSQYICTLWYEFKKVEKLIRAQKTKSGTDVVPQSNGSEKEREDADEDVNFYSNCLDVIQDKMTTAIQDLRLAIEMQIQYNNVHLGREMYQNLCTFAIANMSYLESSYNFPMLQFNIMALGLSLCACCNYVTQSTVHRIEPFIESCIIMIKRMHDIKHKKGKMYVEISSLYQNLEAGTLPLWYECIYGVRQCILTFPSLSDIALDTEWIQDILRMLSEVKVRNVDEFLPAALGSILCICAQHNAEAKTMIKENGGLKIAMRYDFRELEEILRSKN